MNFRNLVLGLITIGSAGFISCSDDPDGSQFPATCAEAQELAVNETGDRPANGTYTLYVDNDEGSPWEAYCHNMNRAEPKDYLTVNESDNFSQMSLGDIVETTFRRYKIDPITLKIDLLDDTFASTTDSLTAIFPDERDHLPAGWAQHGDGSEFGTATARARIDLSGTPFVMADTVVTDTFCTVEAGGDSSASDITIASDLTKVNLSATNTVPSSGITKTVADCSNLSGDDNMGTDDFDKGELKLQYVR